MKRLSQVINPITHETNSSYVQEYSQLSQVHHHLINSAPVTIYTTFLTFYFVRSLKSRATKTAAEFDDLSKIPRFHSRMYCLRITALQIFHLIGEVMQNKPSQLTKNRDFQLKCRGEKLQNGAAYLGYQ
jgi:hypothetical protein